MSYSTIVKFRIQALKEVANFEHWHSVVLDAEATADAHFARQGVTSRIRRVGEVAAKASKDFEYQRAIANRNSAREAAKMYAALAAMEIQLLGAQLDGSLTKAAVKESEAERRRQDEERSKARGAS